MTRVYCRPTIQSTTVSGQFLYVELYKDVFLSVHLIDMITLSHQQQQHQQPQKWHIYLSILPSYHSVGVNLYLFSW